MLSTRDREFFLENGWVVLGPILQAPEVDRLCDAFEGLTEKWATEVGATTAEYLEVVSQWTNLWEHDSEFRDQLHHPLVHRIAEELIGCRAVRVFHDHLIAKPPRGGATVPWHRDLPNLPIAEPRAVSCWLALDEVFDESGAMRFMPGGHLEPISPSIDFLNEEKDWGARDEAAVAVSVPRGWAIFHHCLSWHMSPPNTTDSWRRAYITICMDKESRYFPERASWHPVNKRVTVAAGDEFNDDAFPVLGSLGASHAQD